MCRAGPITEYLYTMQPRSRREVASPPPFLTLFTTRSHRYTSPVVATMGQECRESGPQRRTPTISAQRPYILPRCTQRRGCYHSGYVAYLPFERFLQQPYKVYRRDRTNAVVGIMGSLSEIGRHYQTVDIEYKRLHESIWCAPLQLQKNHLQNSHSKLGFLFNNSRT